MKTIFVFGSNKAGRHGAGSAKAAYENHGAKWGVGEGITGNAYAIPTKDENFAVMSLPAIKEAVDRFKQYATDNPDLIFNVVKIGCGLAGYTDEQISPMFKGGPDNVNLPEGWTK